MAVLVTCHNRRETTLRCLRALETQRSIEHVRRAVFLVDDGSTDGTSESVAAEFPQVRVIRGDGSLYWAGGMRRAMAAAMEDGFDFYLWLNDDTELDSDALSRLLRVHRDVSAETNKEVIVVGSLQHPVTGECTYGGARRSSRWHPLRFERISPGPTPKPCAVFNGNVVLLSREVSEVVGNLHAGLRHTGGDYDYGLRAARVGVASWVAPGFFGTCKRNPEKGTWSEGGLSLAERYRRLLGPKGYPIGPRAVYMSEHGGILWPLLFVAVYLTLPVRHFASRLKSAGR